MTSDTPKLLTYRIDNIPKGTSTDGVKLLFNADDRDAIEFKSLAPDTENYDGDGYLMATILYHGDAASPPRAMKHDIDVSSDFAGFTVLNAVEGVPNNISW